MIITDYKEMDSITIQRQLIRRKELGNTGVGKWSNSENPTEDPTLSVRLLSQA